MEVLVFLPRFGATELSDLLEGQPKCQRPGSHPKPTGYEAFVEGPEPFVVHCLQQTVDRVFV